MATRWAPYPLLKERWAELWCHHCSLRPKSPPDRVPSLRRAIRSTSTLIFLSLCSGVDFDNDNIHDENIMHVRPIRVTSNNGKSIYIKKNNKKKKKRLYRIPPSTPLSRTSCSGGSLLAASREDPGTSTNSGRPALPYPTNESWPRHPYSRKCPRSPRPPPPAPSTSEPPLALASRAGDTPRPNELLLPHGMLYDKQVTYRITYGNKYTPTP